MRYFTSLALVGAAVAQNMSVCDKYTTALLKENNATNQYTLLTLLVNTVVIGSYLPHYLPPPVSYPLLNLRI